MNYIVVKSWDAADEGLRLLRSDVDGRATFLVHPEDSQAKFTFVGRREPPTTTPWMTRSFRSRNAIRVLNGFGKSLEVILPKLGNGYIVTDAAIGRTLALSRAPMRFSSRSRASAPTT